MDDEVGVGILLCTHLQKGCNVVLQAGMQLCGHTS